MTAYHSKLIIVFTRFPTPGKTKTRLIPALGALGAARWHCRTAEKTIRAAARYAGAHDAGVLICFTGADEKQMKKWLGNRFAYVPQADGDIGQKMAAAFSHGHTLGARQMVLVGTDIFQLQHDHFRLAFDRLNHHDVVIGPSTDGGYWLLGLTRPQPVFSNISWSTESVLADTLDRCRQHHLSHFLLNALTDVDTPAELEAVCPEAMDPTPYISVVIPALNEGRSIVAAIDSARDPASEIIVADGGSSDATCRKARDAHATVVVSSRGRAVQQNCGAAAARGEVLLFLHADTRLPVGYAHAVFDTLMDRRNAIGAFQFKTTLNTPLMRFFEKVTHIRSTLLNAPYGDQCLFLKKRTFQQVGGFPKVPVAEDLMLVRRVLRQGRVHIVSLPAVTSARRWRHIGIWQTFFINQLIVAGYAAGISLPVLALFYRKSDRTLWAKNKATEYDKF